MAFFDRYPYTNFHNVNLDWVLQAVKAWGALVEQNNTAFQNLQEANESFKTYVTTYLENLDVQEEINNKLDDLLESGTLTPYMQPYISTEVSEWLEDNITPTTPAVDASLTVSGAAADAKATGDVINEKGAAIDAVNASVTELENSIFSIDRNVPVSDVLTESWLGYSMDAIASPSIMSAHPNDNYNVFWLIFTQAGYAWFEEEPEVSYVAISMINNANNPYVSENNVMRIDGSDGAVRYRKSEGNLPTPTNKLRIPAGAFLAVTIPSSIPPSNFYISFAIGDSEADRTLLNNDVRLNTAQIEQAQAFNYVEYVNEAGSDSSRERLNIYIAKPNGKFILYEMALCFLSERNANIWRISYARLTNSNFTVEKDITTTGEWECAIKINGRSDFAGGFLHGDEITTKFDVFLDGTKKELSAISGKMPFKKLTCVQQSNLYDPNDSTTVFAVHGSVHEFTDNLIIRQSLTFKADNTMGISYLAMFPVLKVVSTKGYTNKDFNYETISVPLNVNGATKVTLTDDVITSEFALKSHSEIDSRTGDLSILDNGGMPYNKCYFLACGNGTTVNNGDVWKAITEYKIII